MDCQKQLFDLPQQYTYLNCAFLSPLLDSVKQAGQMSLKARGMPWKLRPVDFFADSDRFRSAVAKLIHANEKDIAIIPAVSYGMAVAAKNVPIQQGQSIVLLEDQFPSNFYIWKETAVAKNAEIVTVKRPSNWDWTEAIVEKIETRTAVVAVPHCHWTDGSKVDLVQVGKKVREVGARLVVDATQSIGACPFDIRSVRPDFLASTNYKWLFGPYGLSFLYVDPQFHHGNPLEYNWIARQGSEDFSRLVDYQDAYAEGARRFDMGQRSHFHLLPMGIAALEQIQSWTVEKISRYIGKLTGQIEEKSLELGMKTVPASYRENHLIGIQFGGEIPKELPLDLAEKNIFVSVRGHSIRVAPHVYNSSEDIEKLFEALKKYKTS